MEVQPLNDPAVTLRRLRKAAGVSQTVLSHRAGYCRDAVLNYEKGRKNPSLLAYRDIALVLGFELVLLKREV